MTLTAAATIDLIETALADGGYRTLQKQLKALRDEQQVIIERSLNNNYESLKAEAQRIIESLKPLCLPEMTETFETVEPTEAEIYKADFEAVVASLPLLTVVTNLEFENREIPKTVPNGMIEEGAWLSKKQRHEDEPSAIVLMKTPGNLNYVSFAGDALRLVALLGTRSIVQNGALKTLISRIDIGGVLHQAKKKGFDITVDDDERTITLTKATAAPAEGIYWLYFDQDGVCLGGNTHNPNSSWQYDGKFYYTEKQWIPQNLNPVGMTWEAIEVLHIDKVLDILQ